MDGGVKKREWVKNAAIAFLAVLLILTFFSNTWMNRSLPEVATQQVGSGSITAKVRGSGTVTAVGSNTVKAQETREIRAVMVKVGQEVKAGDVLFVLGQGEASALEQAQETLRALEVSYQRTAVGINYPSYALDEKRIADAAAAVEAARVAMEQLAAQQNNANLPISQLQAANNEVSVAAAVQETAKNNLAREQILYDTYKQEYDKLVGEETEKWNTVVLESGEAAAAAEANAAAADANAAALLEQYDILLNEYQSQQQLISEGGTLPEGTAAVSFEELEALRVQKETAETERQIAAADALEKRAKADQDALDAQTALENISDAEVQLHASMVAQAEETLAEADEKLAIAVEKRDAIQATIDEILGQNGSISAEYAAAQNAYRTAQDTLYELQYNLQVKQQTDSRAQQLGYIDLTDIAQQIEKAKEKVLDLSGGEENQITAKVAGTIQSIECAPGDTKLKNDVLCTIEVPDMGYSLSFSVSNEQARRLRIGDEGTVSNYYWGRQITATLNSIKTDPKKPQTNKILTFDVSGDVTAGAELTISVGQKSANYDYIIPSSAIRSDSNGSFVLRVESKSSPLGNRYIARRVDVQVLASDDMNSAVTGNLGYGDYVITTSNVPIKSGDMVRLADNA